jgi:hypothetical protein
MLEFALCYKTISAVGKEFTWNQFVTFSTSLAIRYMLNKYTCTWEHGILKNPKPIFDINAV